MTVIKFYAYTVQGRVKNGEEQNVVRKLMDGCPTCKEANRMEQCTRCGNANLLPTNYKEHKRLRRM